MVDTRSGRSGTAAGSGPATAVTGVSLRGLIPTIPAARMSLATVLPGPSAHPCADRPGSAESSSGTPGPCSARRSRPAAVQPRNTRRHPTPQAGGPPAPARSPPTGPAAAHRQLSPDEPPTGIGRLVSITRWARSTGGRTAEARGLTSSRMIAPQEASHREGRRGQGRTFKER